MERLEKIVRQIDNNELDIDILSEKIKEANEIIAFCTEKLTKADRKRDYRTGTPVGRPGSFPR